MKASRSAESRIKTGRLLNSPTAKNRDDYVKRRNICDRLASSYALGPEDVDLNRLDHALNKSEDSLCRKP